MTEEKKVIGVHEAGSTYRVGDGFSVRNLFPSNGLTGEVDPFLLLDYAAPARVEPGSEMRGVEGHPHRGFEAVTLVYQGYLQHRDSAGNHGTIGPEDVQWLTAGSGVVHEEKYAPELAVPGGTLEFVQLWVNLGTANKMAQPRYQALPKEKIPVITLSQAGYFRVIAGNLSGVDGPAQTFSPVGLFDFRLNAGHETELCLCSGHMGAVVLLKGSVVVNGSTELQGDPKLALLDVQGSMVKVAARTDSTVLIVSGEPLGEPVVHRGAFVMNTRQEIRQAITDYQAGQMGRLA